MKEENIIAIINSGTKEIKNLTIKQFTSDFVLAFIFGLPGCLIPGESKWVIVGILILFLLSPIFSIYCFKNRKKEATIFFYLGGTSLYFCLLLFLTSINFLFIVSPKNSKIYVLIMMSLFLVLAIICYFYIIMSNIKKGIYNNQKEAYKTNSRVLFLAMGVFGIAVGRQFLTGMDQESLLIVLSLCLLFLSVLFMIGILNLLKFYYYNKYKQFM